MTAFFATLAVLALVSLPYALDVYFNSPRDDAAEEEYIPDGR